MQNFKKNTSFQKDELFLFQHQRNAEKTEKLKEKKLSLSTHETHNIFPLSLSTQ
jgi:hypothetical protein